MPRRAPASKDLNKWPGGCSHRIPLVVRLLAEKKTGDLTELLMFLCGRCLLRRRSLRLLLRLLLLLALKLRHTSRERRVTHLLLGILLRSLGLTHQRLAYWGCGIIEHELPRQRVAAITYCLWGMVR